MYHLFLISQPKKYKLITLSTPYSRIHTNYFLLHCCILTVGTLLQSDYTHQCCSQLTVALIELQCWKIFVQMIDFSRIEAGIDGSKFCQSLLNQPKHDPCIPPLVVSAEGVDNIKNSETLLSVNTIYRGYRNL